jgi:hypothetical protein
MFDRNTIRHLHRNRTKEPYYLGFKAVMPHGENLIWYSNFWVERLGWDGLWALFCSPMEDLSRMEFAAVGSSQQLKDYFERIGCGNRVMWDPLKYEWDKGMNERLSNHLTERLNSSYHPLYENYVEYARPNVAWPRNAICNSIPRRYVRGLRDGYSLKDRIDALAN